MSAISNRSDVLELLPLYVLGALEPDEMVQVDAWVRRDQEVATRARELDQATAQLAYAAPDVSLPLDAKPRLLARVRADLDFSQLESIPLPAARPEPKRPRALDTRPPEPTRRKWFGRLEPWALAAGLAALLALLFALNLAQLQTQVALLQTQVAELGVANARLEEQLRLTQSQLAFYAGVDRTVVMQGTAQAPGARGVFYLKGGDGVAIVRGLTPLPSDKSYQLWLVPKGGTPTPVSLVMVQPDGTSLVSVPIPPSLREFAIVDVSIEPAGGSQNITKETIVLRGALP